MNLEKLPDHLKIVDTGDGSPSMEISYSTVSEWMHSSHGAFEESKYIYLHGLEKAHAMNLELKILSVGLGLGYNEILSAGFGLQHDIKVEMNSFESEPFLVGSFRAWCEGELSKDSPLFMVYEKIFRLTVVEMKLEAQSLRQRLHALSSQQKIRHWGTLKPKGPFVPNQTLIHFDPFSSKASPDFWTESFIADFLKSSCADQCVLSTYAATGNLKRMLIKRNFEVDLRPGFAAKRNSIFAHRY